MRSTLRQDQKFARGDLTSEVLMYPQKTVFWRIHLLTKTPFPWKASPLRQPFWSSHLLDTFLVLHKDKVVMRPKPSFLHKVITSFHLFCPDPKYALHWLDVVRAVRVYLKATASIGKSKSLLDHSLILAKNETRYASY